MRVTSERTFAAVLLFCSSASGRRVARLHHLPGGECLLLHTRRKNCVHRVTAIRTQCQLVRAQPSTNALSQAA